MRSCKSAHNHTLNSPNLRITRRTALRTLAAAVGAGGLSAGSAPAQASVQGSKLPNHSMLVFDGAYPMASSAILQDRDLLLPIEQVRAAPKTVRKIEDAPPDTETLATLPELRKGRVAVAVVKLVQRRYWPEWSNYGYRSDEIVYAMHNAQLAYYRILESKGQARILRTQDDLRRHLQQWQNASDTSQLPFGMILAAEGADGILWPEQVREWHAAGLRVVSLAHSGITHYAHGYQHRKGTSGGLFPEGRKLLKEMDSLGMVLDVSHATDDSMRESLEIFSGPVLASHHNCRALVPGPRQIPDPLIKLIVARGAVIGHLMSSNALYNEERHGPLGGRTRRELISLNDFVDHIDHVCQIAGNTRCSGIGADTDGQGGRAGAPREIDTVADYQKLADALARRGFKPEDVENVMYRNWARLFEKALPRKANSG